MMSESATVSATVGSEATGSAAPTVESITADVGNTGEATPSTNEWFYAEGVPGTGDKPEFLHDGTFKSISDQAKGYTDLQSHYSKIMKGFSGAPEADYDYSPSEALTDAGFEFNGDDPYLAKFSEFARESNMNQETYAQCLDMANDFAMGLTAQMNDMMGMENEAFRDSELEQFGLHNAPEFRQAIKAAQNISGVTVDGLSDMLDGMRTAEGLKAFQAMANAKNTSVVPSSPGTPAFDDTESCRLAMKRAEECTNPTQREDLREAANLMYQRVYGSQ